MRRLRGYPDGCESWSWEGCRRQREPSIGGGVCALVAWCGDSASLHVAAFASLSAAEPAAEPAAAKPTAAESTCSTIAATESVCVDWNMLSTTAKPGTAADTTIAATSKSSTAAATSRAPSGHDAGHGRECRRWYKQL